VQIHVKGGVFGNTGLEADMVITGKGVSVVVEIDGATHYNPKFLNKGIESLINTIKADNRKNRLALSIKGVWMVRILYDFGNEVTYVQATLQKLYEILEYIQKMNKLGQELTPKERLVMLDMGSVIRGRSLLDNPGYKKAIKAITGK
jgi:hypothetical protein